MALQVNVGTVHVTNGSTTVRHEWKLLMTSLAPAAGNYTVGASVTWSGGTGTVGAWDSVGKVLHLSRTSGPNPVAGTSINQPAVVTGTVSSVAPGSPPAWDAKVVLPAVATFARHYGDYNVASVAADSFVLTTNYQGATARNIEYGLNTDFTSLGLGLIRPGDVGATNIVTRSMIRLNTLLTRGAANVRLAANLALAASQDLAISWTVEDSDTGGFITVPNQNFVVPAGIARVDIGCSVKLTAALSVAGQTVTIRLLRNANEIALHTLVTGGLGVNLFQGAVPVATSDTFSVKYLTGGSGTFPSILSGTPTNFWIRVAEVI